MLCLTDIYIHTYIDKPHMDFVSWLTATANAYSLYIGCLRQINTGLKNVTLTNQINFYIQSGQNVINNYRFLEEDQHLHFQAS